VSQPEQQANGDVVWEGIVLDITEKKQLEAQLFHAQRLESIGTLASGIAHDLNNILTPVLVAAQLLPRKLPPGDESMQRLLEILEINAKRGGDLVNQILSFARGSDGQRVPLQVGHLLTEIGKMAQQTFPKSIEVHTRIVTQNLWLVHADATQLHQVLMNLCVNARDAMPTGGRLTITVENCVIDQIFARMHLDAKVGAYVKITITDTGTGIAPDVLDRIFDPFFTTKEQGQGTGLGLSTVRRIVKHQGGFLDVSTQMGRGTSFNVYLPALETGEESSNATPVYLEGNSELILVVDDEMEIGQTIKVALEDHHYRVLVAQEEIEALTLYVQHQAEIRVVLLDLMMPSFDEFKLMTALHKLNPQVQLVTMSGLDSNEAKALTRHQVQAFLAKPFTTQDLLITIGQVLARSAVSLD
jgi:nitrogen-specific signal transduction histidine kinase/ActR/RegA family two-component response regulator